MSPDPRLDPWRFQRWAFDTETGNPIRKAVLSMLAMMADMNTGRCEAKQGTLAKGIEVSERAVRGHLKSLEESGRIARRAQFRRDGSRRGDEFLLLAPGVEEWPDGELVHPAPRSGPPGTDRYPPRGIPASGQERPLENDHASKQGDASAGADAREDPRAKPPSDFPEALRPHAREVMRVLTAIAEQHGCSKVWPLQVGRVVMAHPRHPLVAVAHEFAVWAVDPPRKIKSVMGTYQTFLRGSSELAAAERLAEDGTPGVPSPGRSGNVQPLRRYDKDAESAARYERRKAIAQRLIDEKEST